MKDRVTPGKAADFARRILASDRTYQETEKTLWQLYILEGLMRSGGSQVETAKALGVCRHTVQRVVKSLGITASDVERMARAVRGQADANS